MRSINMQIKHRVIKLFLLGLSYDEIVIKVCVSKGSVVNIIEDFRNGKLKLPMNMTEYIDLLRKTAVDVKKNQLSLGKLDVYIRLHIKIKRMGVSDTEVEDWLDIARGISEAGVSNNLFVSCALELARLESREKVNYEELIGRYKAKSKDLEILNKELEEGIVELRRLKQETSKSEEVLRKVRSEAEALRRKLHEEEEKLSRYLKQNGLSWEMVKRTEAVIDRSLQGTGLTSEAIDKVKKEITDAGSLKAYITSLGAKKKRLEKQIRDLSGHVSACQNQLGESNLALQRVNRSLSSKRSDLDRIEKVTASRIANLYISRLILDFLFAPDGLSAADFDNLVRMLIGLRQQRLGIEPRVVTDTSGKVICRCQVPQITTSFKQYKLGYSVAGKTVDSVWTHRKKRAFSGKCVGVEWKGGALSEQLNSDESLQELLLNEFRTYDCDAHVTNDQSRGNTVIIFGDCYPRQWVRLPESLFPSESRIKAVKMIAKKVRESSG